jgi:hypothetical protein
MVGAVFPLVLLLVFVAVVLFFVVFDVNGVDKFKATEGGTVKVGWCGRRCTNTECRGGCGACEDDLD